MVCATIEEFRQQLPDGTRILALDVGEKTIGLAISDALLGIASPLETIRRVKFTKDAEALAEVVKARNIGGFVVGYPINMNGTEGPKCQSIRQFCRSLQERLALPILLWDERMSTMAVNRMMIEADMTRQRRAEVVDKLAASYFLQGALDRLAFLQKQ